MENLKLIVITALSSTGFFTFLQFLINRRDHKVANELKEINEKLLENERDNCRTQMLILMNHYPDDHAEIMKLAQKYFCTLASNWYMTGIFNKWLEKNNIGKPEWFNPVD